MIKKHNPLPIGVVYFIQAADPSLVKIGFSENLKKRIKHLSLMSASPLSVLRTVEGNVALEKAFHRHFSELHVRGEWFRYSPRMVSEMPTPEVPATQCAGDQSKAKSAEYQQAVCGFLKVKYGPLKGAARLLGSLSKSSARTAENWLGGMCAPNGDALIELAASDEDFERLIFDLVEKRRKLFAIREAS